MNEMTDDQRSEFYGELCDVVQEPSKVDASRWARSPRMSTATRPASLPVMSWALLSARQCASAGHRGTGQGTVVQVGLG